MIGHILLTRDRIIVDRETKKACNCRGIDLESMMVSRPSVAEGSEVIQELACLQSRRRKRCFAVISLLDQPVESFLSRISEPAR